MGWGSVRNQCIGPGSWLDERLRRNECAVIAQSVTVGHLLSC